MRLVCIVGPTASGKSALALDLAERLGGEIVSADSRQVYRDLEIGTAKPTAAERARVPHHCLDLVAPGGAFDAARVRDAARAAIADIVRRGRVALVVGGTGLYVRALLGGLCPAPPRVPALRAALAEEAAPALHRRLRALDPAAAARIAPGDRVRIVRALEVALVSGVPLSRWQAEHRFGEPAYDTLLIGLARPTAELDARIAARARAMLEAGFLDEVRALRGRGLGAAAPGLARGRAPPPPARRAPPRAAGAARAPDAVGARTALAPPRPPLGARLPGRPLPRLGRAARRPPLRRGRRDRGRARALSRPRRRGGRAAAGPLDRRARAPQLRHAAPRGVPQGGPPLRAGGALRAPGDHPHRHAGRVPRHRRRGARAGGGDRRQPAHAGRAARAGGERGDRRGRKRRRARPRPRRSGAHAGARLVLGDLARGFRVDPLSRAHARDGGAERGAPAPDGGGARGLRRGGRDRGRAGRRCAPPAGAGGRAPRPCARAPPDGARPCAAGRAGRAPLRALPAHRERSACGVIWSSAPPDRIRFAFDVARAIGEKVR